MMMGCRARFVLLRPAQTHVGKQTCAHSSLSSYNWPQGSTLSAVDPWNRTVSAKIAGRYVRPVLSCQNTFTCLYLGLEELLLGNTTNQVPKLVRKDPELQLDGNTRHTNFTGHIWPRGR